MALNRIHPVADLNFDESQLDLHAYLFLETLHMRKHTRTYCAVMDIGKAFDVVWRDGAMPRLHRAGVQGGLWHWVDDNTYCRLRCFALAQVQFKVDF